MNISLCLLVAATLNWTKADYPVWRDMFDPSAPTGWTVQYFGDPAFALRCGVKSVTNNAIRLDFGRGGKDGCQWPMTNHNPANGPTFSRGRLSAAAFSQLTVPADGQYAFRVVSGGGDTCVWRVQVNGCDLAERVGKIELKAGVAEVALYGRQRRDLDRCWPMAACSLQWQRPGAAAFEPVPAAALKPKADDAERPAVPIVHELPLKDGRIDYHAYRSWDFEIPEDGVYRIVVHSGTLYAHLRLWLDGLQIGFWQSRSGLDWNGGHAGEVDTQGRTDIFRCDFYGRWSFVRRFKKGRHTVDFFANPGPWFWDDRMAELMTRGTLRIGWEKVDERNPDSARGFWFEGRDDVVCSLGEKFELQQVNAEGCVLKVDGRAMPGWTLPTDTEGVHRFTVENARGETVFGPWEYPVVGTAATGATTKGARSAKVVDRVDCTKNDHQFRDNGTSEVKRTKDGVAYRQVGATGIHGVGYRWVDARRRDRGMRPVAPGEKGEANLTAHDWFAYSLKVEKVGVPHILRFTSPKSSEPRINSVYAVDPKTGQYNGWNLMTGVGAASGPSSACSFFVWPNTSWIDVLVINSDGNHNSKHDRRSAVATMELIECADGLPPLAPPAGGWQSGHDFGWEGEQVDLGVNERTMPDLLPSGEMVPAVGGSYVYRDWKALMTAWDRFGDVSAWRGDNLVFQPVNTYGMRLYGGRASLLTFPDGDVYVRGSHNRFVDPFDRDVFKLMLLEAGRRNVRLVADCMIQRITSATVSEWAAAYGQPAMTNGLLLSERADGVPFRSFSGSYFPNPAHPIAQRRMIEFCRELGKRYGRFPAFAGIRHRFWRGWPASFEPTFFKESLGFDDFSVSLFEREMGVRLPPRLAWADRKQLILNDYPGRWAQWRTAKVLKLHEQMLAALREGAPQARFYAQNTGEGAGSEDVWRKEAGLDRAAFRGRRELGYLEDQAYILGPDVEINHLDPQCFAAFNVRGGSAANPSTTNGVFFGLTYPQGLCCNRTYNASPYHLEPAAKALADNRLKQLLAGGQWCLPPADGALRRFVRAYRAIPDVEFVPAFPAEVAVAPVAVWTRQGGSGLFFFAVNRTDRPRKLQVLLDGEAAALEDVVTGETLSSVRKFEIALPPFGVAVRRTASSRKIVAAQCPVDADERQRLEAELAFIESFKDWDSLAAATPSILAMKKARAAHDYGELRRLVALFRRDQTSWYETHAWPKDWHVYRPIWRNTISSVVGQKRSEYQVENPEAGNPRTRIAPYKEDFLTAKKDVPITFSLSGAVGGWRALTITALFGGGYGPIDVLVDGKLVGTFAAGTTDEPRLETRTLATPLLCRGNFIRFSLVARGERGLAVNRMTKSYTCERIVRNWRVRRAGEATWREVTLPDGETMLDLKSVLGSPKSLEDEAELETTLKGRGGTTLLWKSSYFGSIEVNGKPFCAELRGPTERYGSRYLQLDNSGPGGTNVIRVRLRPGEDGRWRIGLQLLMEKQTE